MSIASSTPRRRRRSSRGQSLVEFALVLPVLLILVLMAIDFGRLFSSWVTLNNAARVAANYAAANPYEAFGAGSDYETQVNKEGFGSLNATCATAGVPVPDFADTAVDTNTTKRNMGDVATVSISCNFKVLTPIISAVVGSSFPVSASSSFTIRTGVYLQ
jgi:Flp pilus assembly protein TadG